MARKRPEPNHGFNPKQRQGKADAAREVELGRTAYEAERRERKFGAVKSFFNRVKSRKQKEALDKRKRQSKEK